MISINSLKNVRQKVRRIGNCLNPISGRSEVELSKSDRPTGKLYSAVYLLSDNLSDDSSRFRKRLERLLSRFMNDYMRKELGTLIEGRLGIKISRNQYDGSFRIPSFIIEAELQDVLDTITISAYLFRDPTHKEEWIKEVRDILAQQQMAYEIDDKGGIHPFVDAELSASKKATIAALSDSRLVTARERFQEACDLLRSDSSSAIEKVFKATENIFKQIFDGSKNRLNAHGVRNDLKARFRSIYSQNGTATKVAERMCESFAAWVDAAHNYRHDAGDQTPVATPFDIATLMVSQGAGYLRWMAENFDALREVE